MSHHNQINLSFGHSGFVIEQSSDDVPTPIQQPSGPPRDHNLPAADADPAKWVTASNKTPGTGPAMDSQTESLFFIDGKKRIDMVLVYEDDLDSVKVESRKNFLKGLLAKGLEIETQDQNAVGLAKTPNHGEKVPHFVKIHAPWAVVSNYAEIMNMKMPVKDRPKSQTGSAILTTADSAGGKRSLWHNLRNLTHFDYNHERVSATEPAYYRANFSRQKEECFIIKDRETFFSPAQRSQIVWKILSRIRPDDKKIQDYRDKIGIKRLLSDGTFEAAYPLHEGSYEHEEPGQQPNDRRLLYTEWAHVSNWYKKQPLWLVRRYFGDKVGLYFAWLGYYTGMLVPASVVGVLCFLFGLATIGTDSNAPSREICEKDIGGSIVMCPLCGHCQVWKLDDSCTFSKLTYFFDNPATVFFAIFMAFWATSFLEFWKRKQAVISWEWDLHSYEVIEEREREFETAVKKSRLDPVVQDEVEESLLTVGSRAVRMLVVSSIVLLLLCISGAVIMGIAISQLVMRSVLYTTTEGSYEFLKDNAKIISSVSGSVINLIIVVLLQERVYLKVAIWLTKSECPRTQTEYEDSFTFKMFLFQFINYYSYLIYIAFFKGRFFRHPGDDSDNVFEKIRGDMCDPAGCLSELFIQLSTVMIGKQFLNNFMEAFMPKFSNWFRTVRNTKSTMVEALRTHHAPGFLTRWEHDYKLIEVDQLALFEEYLEMVIQYGFVTLFVAAFPLAPLFALLNNIVEIRVDAYKWITQLRRPVAEQVEDIGAWYGILQGITYTSVVTNAFVIAYTSDVIPRLVYKYTTEGGSLEGYIDSSLSVYSTEGYKLEQRTIKGVEYSTCRYRGYYNHHNDTNPTPSDRYWHIMAARLTFVAVFEHLVFALTGLMAFAIPDVPSEIEAQIEREKVLVNETLHETDLARLRQQARHQALTTMAMVTGSRERQVDDEHEHRFRIRVESQKLKDIT